MKKSRIITVEHNPGDPPIQTDTNWDEIAALTDEQIHATALSDRDGAPIPVHATPGLTPVVNTRKLGKKLGMTQEEFAATYRIPVGTLSDWEQGRKFPDAPARAYLTVIAKNPKAVARFLGEAA